MAERSTPATPFEQALRAWQNNMNAFARAWQPPDPTAAKPAADTLNRILAGLVELAGAQFAVTVSWVELPFALATGNLSAMQDLQRNYARLLQAYTTLFQAYMPAASAVRRAATDAARTAARAATPPATQPAAQAAQEPARDPIEQVEKGTARAQATAQAAPRVNAVEEALHVAEAAAKKAERAARRSTSVDPARPIKGKIGRKGTRIYHMPGQANYDRFDADALFATEEEARAAGFRPAQR